MPEDAPPNGDAPLPAVPVGPRQRVSEMQATVHSWAAADPGRPFDDLVNLVHDPATLIVAFDRVAGKRGANTAGVDGWTDSAVEEFVRVLGFLDDLRTLVKLALAVRDPVVDPASPQPSGTGFGITRGSGRRC